MPELKKIIINISYSHYKCLWHIFLHPPSSSSLSIMALIRFDIRNHHREEDYGDYRVIFEFTHRPTWLWVVPWLVGRYRKYTLTTRIVSRPHGGTHMLPVQCNGCCGCCNWISNQMQSTLIVSVFINQFKGDDDHQVQVINNTDIVINL